MAGNAVPQSWKDWSDWYNANRAQEEEIKKAPAPWATPGQQTGLDYLTEMYQSMFGGTPPQAPESQQQMHQPSQEEAQAMQDIMALRDQLGVTADEAIQLYNKGARPE